MPVLQQYYTSYNNEIARNVGYQVKATSPGISPQLQQEIDRLISYRIPPSMDERAIAIHPIALRYMYDSERPNESIFLCSQSTGSDPNGRPGNFFAHTIVTEPDIFASVPPILYWKSSFWQNKDTQSRSHIDSLPILPTFDVEPSFDIEGMWDFLDQGKRREWLYKLLCAVIHCNKTYRRIVILDTTDNVVWWVAVISSLLPPDYRPLLSFATYFHDPTASPFMITGITNDVFRSSQNMYSSYFVLNTGEDRCSDVEGSLYAEVVTGAAHPDSYYDQLLPLLTFAKRFPKPTAIDEQLDRVMLYAKMQTGRTVTPQTPISPEEVAVIQQAVQSIAQLPDLRPGEVDELNPLEELEHLRGILADALRLQQSPALAAEYSKVNHLLQKQKDDQELQAMHEMLNELERVPELTPQQVKTLENAQTVLAEMLSMQRSPIRAAQFERINSLLKRNWARNSERVQGTLKAFVEYLIQSQEQEIHVTRLNQLQQTYGDALLGEQINQPAFLSWLIEMLMQRNSRQVLLAWQYLGKYILPSSQSQSLLILSLRVVQRLWNEQRLSDMNNLLDAMLAAMAGNELKWLELAVSSNDSEISQSALPNFYYKLVCQLELDQRLPYRNAIFRLYGANILNYEIANDMYNADIQQGLPTIEHWMRHARQQQYDTASLLTIALEQLQKKCTPQQWREVAMAMLVSDHLMPLPQDIEERLVSLVVPALSLTMKSISPTDIELCRRYQNNQNLSEDTRTTLATILAMTNGTMDQALAQRIQAQVKILLPHEYIPGVQRFLPEFFQHNVIPDAHRWAIIAFFTRAFGYDVPFWQAYQTTLSQLFLNPATTLKAVDMLDFWFTTKSGDFPPSSFIIQEFFLKLSSVLAGLQQSSGFFVPAQGFTSFAANKSWYSVIQVYFPEKEKVLGGLGGAFNQHVIAPVLQKLNPSSGKELEERKQRLAGKVEALFDKKRRVSTQHELISREYYDPQLREQFWTSYWHLFRNLLMTGEVEATLDILSFWFDIAYQTQEKAYYLPQTFFLDFYASLNPVYSTPAFQETARRIEEKIAAQKKDPYPWYPLIRNYFTLPASGKSNGA